MCPIKLKANVVHTETEMQGGSTAVREHNDKDQGHPDKSATLYGGGHRRLLWGAGRNAPVDSFAAGWWLGGSAVTAWIFRAA